MVKEPSKGMRRDDLKDFECDTVVGVRLSISETAGQLGFCCISISRVYKGWDNKDDTRSENNDQTVLS